MRYLVRANAVWFAAKDVCDALGISNVSEALREIPSHGKISTAVSHGRRLIMINTAAMGLLACRPEFKKFFSSAIECGERMLRRPQKVSDDDGFYTVSEYAGKLGLRLCSSEASRMGKLASELSKVRGLPIHRHEHGVFGAVNAYAEEVMAEVLKDADEA